MMQHPSPDTALGATLLSGLELLEQGITVFDAGLRLVACNQRFLTLLDFPPQLAAVGTPFEAFIRYNACRGEYGPGDAELQVAERVVRAQRFERHEFERRRPDGSLLRVRGAPLPQGGFITLYSALDAGQAAARHRQAPAPDPAGHAAGLQQARQQLYAVQLANEQLAAALQRSEQRLRLITDTIPALIAYFDHGQIYRYANKGYADWFGRDSAQMSGRHISQALGSKFYAAVQRYVEEALTGKQLSYEYSMEKDDGSTIFARSTLVPEIAAGGEVLGCFVLSFDITEQKQTRAALVQAQKMEAIGQLSGGMAHDFNNMLTVVLGNLGELRRRLPPQPALLDYLDPALHAAGRGVELVRRLLGFARQQPLLAQPVQIGGLIRGMMQLLQRSLPENIVPDCQLAAEHDYVMADANQLESAILNLVLNARDAMPDGGRLQIAANVETLDARTAAEWQLAAGDYIRIDVTDNGCGMTPEVQLRVFEPFFTTKQFGSGSGLGLAMVYGFARQSGGQVSVSSQPGCGSVFSLRLPRTTPTAQPHGRLDFSGRAGGRERPLVLLVEDDPEVRRVVQRQLSALSYPVVEAENGDEAATLLASIADIGLLLSDIVMPGRLGGRCLAALARQQRPEIRILLMSGYAAPAEAEDDRTRDIPLLAKPFTEAQLGRMLDEVMLCPRTN
ncbi:PAS-domain containing protein [Vogesella fluminis]|uniref:histidine kinase n=1 Tax=Vogesella fluminis TaxID=1069161 RepID=A0ABQ3H678_9NEIS|nr:PAS-domain containing protein [Vogesella fluminis]GHD72675.1 signal transduction histidine kinase [Vogesella fluminis]